MKNLSLILLILINTGSFAQVSGLNKPDIEPNVIAKDLMSWLYYERDHLAWSSDYIPLDSVFKEMEKSKFISALAEGRFLPLKFSSKDGNIYYQLYPQNNLDESISSVLKREALKQFRYTKLYGKELPNFGYVDINGDVFNPESTKGKVIVLNCWFTSCKPCIAEMPELNILVDTYKGRSDILFISLAKNNVTEIKQFLKKHQFNYKIVPDKSFYMENELLIEGFPTQLIVDRQGKIVKIINGAKINELKALLLKVDKQD